MPLSIYLQISLSTLIQPYLLLFILIYPYLLLSTSMFIPLSIPIFHYLSLSILKYHNNSLSILLTKKSASYSTKIVSFRQDFKHFGQNTPYRMLYKIRNFGLIFKILLSNGLSGPEFSAKTITSQFPQQTAEKMLNNSQKW